MSRASLAKENAAASRANIASRAPTSNLGSSDTHDAFDQQESHAGHGVMDGRSTRREWSLSQVRFGNEDNNPAGVIRKTGAGNSLATSGRPLDLNTRTLMEDRFAYDFSQVRVHTDESSANSAKALRAKAYTVGSDITFGRNRYAPETRAGQRLLAHELAHVVQQNRGGPTFQSQLHGSHEQEAKQAADEFIAGEPVFSILGASAVGVARAKDDEPDEEDKRFRKKPKTKTAERGFEILKSFKERAHDAPSEELAEERLGRRTRRSEETRHRSDEDDVQGHHGYPKFLGGRKLQKLIPLTRDQHYVYHEMLYDLLDKEFKARGKLPAEAGRMSRKHYGRIFSRLSEADKAAVLEKIIDQAEEFDAQHSKKYPDKRRRLAAALRRGIKEAKAAPAKSKTATAPRAATKPPAVPAPRPTTGAVAGAHPQPAQPAPHPAAQGLPKQPAPKAPATPAPEHAVTPGAGEHSQSPAPAAPIASHEEPPASKAPPPPKKASAAPISSAAVAPVPAAPVRPKPPVPAPNVPAKTAAQPPVQETKAKPPISPKAAKPAAAPAGPVQLVSQAKAGAAPEKITIHPRQAGTSTKEVRRGASLIAGPDKMGASGSLGGQATQARGHGLQTTQSVDFGGKVVTNVEEIPGTSPPRYRVTLTIDLSAGVGVGASREGKVSGSVSGAASGSLTMSVAHEMTGEDKEKYLKAVKGGEGGASEELRVAQMVAKGRIDEAKDYLAQRKSLQGSAAEAKHMSEGDEVTLSAGGKAEGKAGVSGSRVGVEFGLSQSGELTQTRALRDGKIVLTISVAGEKGMSLGGSFSEGVAGMGVTHESGKSSSKAVTFVLDPNDPNFDSLYNEVVAVKTADGLSKLAARRPELTGSTTTGKGTSSMLTTSASVGPLGLSIKQGHSYSEEETKDASGVSHKYTGSGTLGGSLSVAGKEVAASSTTDQFTGTVGPDKTATGETSSATTETDYLGSLQKLISSGEKRPVGTTLGVATGGAKVLQEKTEIQGKKLTDDSYARLAELAKDPAAWQHSWSGSVSTFVDWEATRKKVLAADGDRDKIAKALAEFESQGSGRSRTLETAVADTGIAFDFPEELKDQKPIYDQLVAGDPLAHPRDLANAGRPEDAVAELKSDNDRLGALLRQLQMHQQDVQNPAALAEMMQRISQRRTAIRSEIRRLSPQKLAGDSSAAQADKKEIPAPDAAKAAAEAEAAQKREERNAKIDDLIPTLLTNQEKERANFAVVYEELKKENSWFSKPDVIVISEKLTELKRLYEKWDKSVAELREVYKDRGDDPGRANQYAPNRAEWNALHRRVFSSY